MGASKVAFDPAAFKAYDIRGRIPHQLNETVAYEIGRAFVHYLTRADNPASATQESATKNKATAGRRSQMRIVVGYDIRNSSPALGDALSTGLVDAGAQVIHIGQCGTEEVYFATAHLGAAGGVMITASHNPKDYNGMKLVRKEARPISGDSGLKDIAAIVEQALSSAPSAGAAASIGDSNNDKGSANEGKQGGKGEGKGGRGTPQHRNDSIVSQNIRPSYIECLLNYVDRDALRPMKIVCNAGNGGAGAVIDLLEQHLPFQFIKLQHEPNGNFPNGVPNPLLEENREPTRDAVIKHGADMGIAWDGDFDRCFFFDARGRFIEGYYIVGLLAEVFAAREAGAKIVHDPRLIWNTVEAVKATGGKSVQCKAGHAFIKERMRAEGAIYGGEMSAHHYFRDFFYCDSGMIPWLLVGELMCRRRKSLAEMVDAAMAAYPVSGEINRRVENPQALLESMESRYGPQAQAVDYIDGLSIDLGDCRFNLRPSNTEPVLRVNVEARASAFASAAGDDEADKQAAQRMQQVTDEILGLIEKVE